MDKPLMTAAQVARAADVSVDAVRYHVRTGTLVPTVRAGRDGRMALFSAANAERWAKSRMKAKGKADAA